MSQQVNPFKAPASNVEPIKPADKLEPASKSRRFGTFLVDYAAYMALSFTTGLVIGVVFGPAGHKVIHSIPDTIFGAAVFLAYYVFFEGIWSRTPGKWALGTVVVNENGGKPNFGQIVGRTLCRFIPFEAFSFFGTKGWHDSIPKTQVVRVQQLP